MIKSERFGRRSNPKCYVFLSGPFTVSSSFVCLCDLSNTWSKGINRSFLYMFEDEHLGVQRNQGFCCRTFLWLPLKFISVLGARLSVCVCVCAHLCLYVCWLPIGAQRHMVVQLQRPDSAIWSRACRSPLRLAQERMERKIKDDSEKMAFYLKIVQSL